MSGDRDKCGLSSLLPMSCRGRAESFARRLHSRLRSLGSQDCDSSADENSWLAAHEASTAVSHQPRHNSDGDLYFHFGLLESPGSPVDEIAETEFSKLITNCADNLQPNHGAECHCPKKSDNLPLPKGSSQDSDSSDGVYYDPEVTESEGLEQNCCTNHVNGVASPSAEHDDAVTNHKGEDDVFDDDGAKEDCISDGQVSPVSSESTAAPPSLTLSEEESTLSLHDDEYNSLEYSHLQDIPLTELHEDRYLYQGQICCNSSTDEKFLTKHNDNQTNTSKIVETQRQIDEDLKQDNSECSATLNVNVASPSHTEDVSCIRDNIEPLCETNSPVDSNDEVQESFCNTLEVDKEMVIECTDTSPIRTATAALDIPSPCDDGDDDEETKEACRFLQSLGSPKKEFKEVCQMLQVVEDEDEQAVVAVVNDEEEERIPRVRRCSSLKTGKTPPGTPGRKKIVRFADVLGLDLADVRTFMDEIPKVPAAAYSDLMNADLSHSVSDPTLNISPSMAEFQPHVGPKPDKILLPLFQQPSSQADFLDKIKEKQLCLENAMVLDPVNFSITGIVRVRNLDFHKSVHVRYSLDSWKSFADLQATYCPNSCDGFSDKFEFLLYCHTLTVGQRIEFAVRFQCKGFQYWDNNEGANYCFQCLPATSSTPYIPITGIDGHWQNSAVFY